MFNRKKQKGITLTETLLTLSVAAVVSVIGYQGYKVANADISVSDQTGATVTMIGKIKQVFGASGSYAVLNTTPGLQLANAGLLPEQFKYDADEDEILDVFGNTMGITGANRSFTVLLSDLTRESCAKIASGLSTIAYKITVGTDADHASGVVAGATVYKDPAGGGTLSSTALASGCGATNSKVAVEIR